MGDQRTYPEGDRRGSVETQFKPRRIFAWLFDRFAPGVDAAGFAEHRRMLVEGIEGRVLEIGAGTGLNLDKYRKAAEVVALEPDPHMRKRLEPVAAQATVPVTVVQGTAYPLPFEDQSFDAVVFCQVLCTVPEPDLALRDARRVLTAEGEIYFMEHVRSEDPNLARWQDRAQKLWRFFGGGCHLNRDTLSTIERAGFTVDSLERFSFDTGGFTVLARPHIRGRAHNRGGATHRI
jgi:ubiquinone/menaquinone biosynthesis C-methylase UbiE